MLSAHKVRRRHNDFAIARRLIAPSYQRALNALNGGTQYQNRTTGTVELTFQETQVVGRESQGSVETSKANHQLCTVLECNATPGETRSNKNKQTKQTAMRACGHKANARFLVVPTTV